MRTSFRVYGAGSEVDSILGSVARQNVMSKIESVSSFDWAQILLGLSRANPDADFAAVVELYNNHPDVVAHRTHDPDEEADDESGWDCNASTGGRQLRAGVPLAWGASSGPVFRWLAGVPQASNAS